MKVRATIPLRIYLIGDSEEALPVSTSFKFSNLTVSVSISPTTVYPISSENGKTEYFSLSTGIGLLLEESPPLSFLTAIVKSQDLTKLVQLLTTVANRVVLAIRNFGAVPHLKEFHPNLVEPETLLTRWNVEFNEGDDNWRSMQSGGLLALSASLASEEPCPALRVARWPDITEAIQDELEPAPEQEFLTNCVEHLRERNFRLALIESIICLEIVLNQFLRNHLQLEKKLPKERVKKFLSPNFGLTARVAGLLELTLDKHTLGKIDIGSVLTAVEWRNKVMHETGRLPNGIDDRTLLRHITAVLELATYLGMKRDEITAGPKLRTLAQALAQELGVPAPTMRRLAQHVVWVEYFFFSVSEVPSQEQMKRIAERTGQALRRLDERFEPGKHLYVRFLTLAGAQWSWWKGNLVQTSRAGFGAS